MNNRPVFIDLFAGCGGLSLGLEQAGFFPIYVNELNKSAMDTYLLNRNISNPLLLERYHSYDIKELLNNSSYLFNLMDGFKLDYEVNDIDLLVGGPPCQGFSGIGYRRSYNVDKNQLPSNHLYRDMAYIISIIRPKIFLFENVRGLLSARWTKDGEVGEIWEDVKRTFENIPGYVIQSALIYAKDYGIPQYRPRVLLVGIREDILIKVKTSNQDIACGFLPNPRGKYPTLHDLLGDLIDPFFINGGSTSLYPNDPFNSWQEQFRLNPYTGHILHKSAPLTEQKYSFHSPEIIEKFEHMLCNNGEISDEHKTRKFSQRLLPSEWDDRGPTITATSMPDDYVHFSQPRTLTVREWARLQFFPDWYMFSGPRTTGGVRRAGNPRIGNFHREIPKYTQIGNAVPVRLAKTLGEHFLKILNFV